VTVRPETPRCKPHVLPPTTTPSRRAAHHNLSPALYASSAKRIRYRIDFVWTDPARPGARREECIEFADPRRLMDLIRRVSETPDRPLLSARLLAKPTPKWEDVSVDFVAWRAAERERKGGVR
jgi:hypothetical protein